MKRPIGISVIALICFATAVVFMVTGILFAALPQHLAASGFKQDVQPLQRLFGLGFFGLVGLLLAYVGYSLWVLRPWGRSFAIGTACAGLLPVIEGVIRGYSRLTTGLILLGCVATLWYLSLPRVRSAFADEGRSD